MKDKELKSRKSFMANLALYGLLETLIDPACPKRALEAHRIVFNADSTEMKTIAALLEIDPGALQKAAFAYLEERGFPVNLATKH